MAKCVTSDEVILFHKLYQKYGTFAEVARHSDRSAKTVARYIKAKGTPKIVNHTLKEIIHQLS